jgi:hypothetical protein
MIKGPVRNCSLPTFQQGSTRKEISRPPLLGIDTSPQAKWERYGT